MSTSIGRANEPVSPVADDAFTRGLGNKECLHPLRYRGLTIREHFAALAMQGQIAAARTQYQLAGKMAIAKDCVEWADVLLGELEKPR